MYVLTNIAPQLIRETVDMKSVPANTSPFAFISLLLLSSTSAFGAYGVSKSRHRSGKRLPLTVRKQHFNFLHLASNSNVAADDPDGKIKSAALEWMSEQRRQLSQEDIKEEPIEPSNKEIVVTANKKKIVVVGGGWAGWGAVKTLCRCSEIDAHIILLDVLPDPTGETPYLSKTGKPVEAGTRGFWKDYPNINALCKELGLNEQDVFTPFTNSSFYS